MCPRFLKSESRQRFAELRRIVCEWDPIGVFDDPDWPRDEYDCLVSPLLRLLESGETNVIISAYLREQIVEHFGLDPEPYDFQDVADRMQRWFADYWLSLGEIVTVYVALRDEGTKVWRPVKARILPGNRYRIVDPPVVPVDEDWEHPPGAVVSCEERTFSEGEPALVAVNANAQYS